MKQVGKYHLGVQLIWIFGLPLSGRKKQHTHRTHTYIGGGKFDLSDESLEPVDSTTKIKNGDLLTFLINEQKRVRAEKWLIENSFQSADI